MLICKRLFRVSTLNLLRLIKLNMNFIRKRMNLDSTKAALGTQWRLLLSVKCFLCRPLGGRVHLGFHFQVKCHFFRRRSLTAWVKVAPQSLYMAIKIFFTWYLIITYWWIIHLLYYNISFMGEETVSSSQTTLFLELKR